MIAVDASALRALVLDAVREALRESGAATAGDEYLSVARAATMADVAPGTIRGWINQGHLTRHHAGRVLRVKRSELEALLAAPPATPEAAARRAFGGTR